MVMAAGKKGRSSMSSECSQAAAPAAADIDVKGATGLAVEEGMRRGCASVYTRALWFAHLGVLALSVCACCLGAVWDCMLLSGKYLAG
jgi:hypothetical protein